MFEISERAPPAQNAPAMSKYFPDSKNVQRTDFGKILATLA